MFGVLRGAGCGMSKAQKEEWMNHICGVCLALRDESGQAARINTNYDSALVSVLCTAQTDEEPQMMTSTCALRGPRLRTQVVSPQNGSAKYAAALALTAGATKVQDHLEDDETALRHMPWISGRIADGWRTAGQKLAGVMGFDTADIIAQTEVQATVEAQPAADFFHYARPTELAIAGAFGHTAVVADRPHNADILREMGRLFGRIMYLLDAYEDYDDDLEQGKFNALAAAFAPAQIKSEAQAIFTDAHKQLTKLFHKLDLPQPALARQLLVVQLKKRGRSLLDMGRVACATCSCNTAVDDTDASSGGLSNMLGIGNLARRRGKKKRSFGCCEALICCDCCSDCCCCCDFDICECDEGGCEICTCDLCCGCCDVECCDCSECCCDCDCG